MVLMKQSIVQQIDELKAREAKIVEIENLIPLSRQLLASHPTRYKRKL